MNERAGQRLFREQAIEHQLDRAFGEVLRTRPMTLSVLTGITALAAASALVFSFWGEYTRKAHVAGYLAPADGFVRVFAPQAGTILEKHVIEGQTVRRGDSLFVISTERSSVDTVETQAAVLAQVKQRIASLRSELEKQIRIDELSERTIATRLQNLRTELAASETEFALQKRRVEIAEKTVARFSQLLADKFVSDAQLQQKTEELLDQQTRSQGIERAGLSLRRDIAGAESDLAISVPRAANVQASIQRNIMELEQQLTEGESRRAFVVTAPTDGVATAILGERGQMVSPTAPLLSLIPRDSALEAHLLLPSRSVGFVQNDQAVRLRYDSYPYQHFGQYKGVVRSVSKTIISPNETPLPLQLTEPSYRVTVKIDSQTVAGYGKTYPLQAGMLVSADILLERRRLIDWLFEPIYGFAGRV